MFKMLTNNFYRGIGYLVMGSFYQTQFYLFLSYLIKSPCVSFPSTQCYSVSLRHFYCIFVFCSFPPPCSNQKYKEANKFKKHSALKCLLNKASRRICAVILPSIITMPRTGNPYCREDDLCSDAEDGGLIAELSSMKCRRSAMPPMLHTRDAV